MKVRFVRALRIFRALNNTLLASLLSAAVLLAMSSPGYAQSGKPRILGYFLMLDGEPAGWMYAIEGGGLDADVLPDAIGDDGFLRKRPGRVKYENITLTVGAEMSKKFYDWIQQSFDRRSAKYARKGGAIIAADYNYKAVRRIDFEGALITEIGLPALDKTSKGNARLFVRFQPDQRVITPLPGDTPVDAPKFRQKQWLASNFRLAIDGLEKPCSRVSKVDAITLKQKVALENGEELLVRDVCNFSLTLPAADSDPFHLWFESSVVKGQTDARSATLDYLNANGATLFTLHLPQTGLFGESWVDPKSGEETPLTDIKYHCFCNSGWLEYSGH